MLPILFIFTFCVSLFFSMDVYSQSNVQSEPDPVQVARSMKNPFMPQLPVPLEDIPVEARVTPTPSPVIQSIENTDVVPEPEIPDPDYTVNGLVWNTPRPQAILDDEIVNLGDQLGIWTITAISREGVTLSYESKSVVLAPSVK